MTIGTDASSSSSQQVESALPRRFLRPLLLLALGSHDRSYGYELAEAVRANGLSVDLAGVYRELRAMERQDLLTSDWEPSTNGPDRRVYLMTDQGRTARAAATESLRLARDQLTTALEQASEV